MFMFNVGCQGFMTNARGDGRTRGALRAGAAAAARHAGEGGAEPYSPLEARAAETNDRLRGLGRGAAVRAAKARLHGGQHAVQHVHRGEQHPAVRQARTCAAASVVVRTRGHGMQPSEKGGRWPREAVCEDWREAGGS